MLKVAVQEQRRLLRSGIAAMLSREPGVEVSVIAETNTELVEACAVERPALAIIELHVDAWDVEQLCAELRATGVRHICALHTGRRSDEERYASKLDIEVLIPYGAGKTALLAAVGRIESDERPRTERRSLPSRQILTPRECDVLRYVAAGLTTFESAVLLKISPKTVDNHKQRIFSKLGVQNQAHAVALAHRIGILQSRSARIG